MSYAGGISATHLKITAIYIVMCQERDFPGIFFIIKTMASQRNLLDML